MITFWEGLVMGVAMAIGTLFLARLLAPKKSYFDLHKDEKTSTPDYKGLE